jgi:hypothetical protein
MDSTPENLRRNPETPLTIKPFILGFSLKIQPYISAEYQQAFGYLGKKRWISPAALLACEAGAQKLWQTNLRIAAIYGGEVTSWVTCGRCSSKKLLGMRFSQGLNYRFAREPAMASN